MERVVVARVDRSAPGRAVVRWASQEATLRGLPLRVIRHPLPDFLDEAQLVVADMRVLDAVAFSARPVVLIPEERAVRHPPHRVAEIVLGVDARDPAGGALDFAFDTARLWGVRLRAVHAWWFPSCAAELPFGVPEEDRATWEDHEVQLLADALRRWREKYPEVRVLEDVRLFTPPHALLQLSASAGLVVVGRGSRGEPGPTVRALLPESLCPVAVVPS
ncbi:universal stress protein [Streptomyces sp. NPDC126514]|uniref:universal stress protein n=1 Tax=Streptomyces sp. NPDC126514 TaxID=3155210 RepID=UPI003317F6A7